MADGQGEGEHTLLPYTVLESGELGVLLRVDPCSGLHAFTFSASNGARSLSAAASVAFAQAVAADCFGGDVSAAEAYSSAKLTAAKGVLELRDATGKCALLAFPSKRLPLSPATEREDAGVGNAREGMCWVRLAFVLEAALADGALDVDRAPSDGINVALAPADAERTVSRALALALDVTEAADALRALLLSTEPAAEGSGGGGARRSSGSHAGSVPSAMGGGAVRACVPRRVATSSVFVACPLALCDYELLNALGVKGLLCLAPRHTQLAARTAAALGGPLALADARPPPGVAGADLAALTLGAIALFAAHVDSGNGSLLIVWQPEEAERGGAARRAPASPRAAAPPRGGLAAARAAGAAGVPLALAVLAATSLAPLAPPASAAGKGAGRGSGGGASGRSGEAEGAGGTDAALSAAVRDVCAALAEVAPDCGASAIERWHAKGQGAVAAWAPQAPEARAAAKAGASSLPSLAGAGAGAEQRGRRKEEGTREEEEGSCWLSARQGGLSLCALLSEGRWLAHAHSIADMGIYAGAHSQQAKASSAAHAPPAVPTGDGAQPQPCAPPASLGLVRVLRRPRELLLRPTSPATAAASAQPCTAHATAAATGAREGAGREEAGAQLAGSQALPPSVRCAPAAAAAGAPFSSVAGTQPEPAAARAAPRADAAAEAPAAEGHEEVLRYCCPRCRSQLFVSSVILPHEPLDASSAAKGAVFGRTRRSGGAHASQSACTSLFLDPDVLLASPHDGGVHSALTEAGGKLLCAKCATRVGSLAWAGSQCACGAWVVPAVQIVRSKVDVRRPLLSAAALGARAAALPVATASPCLERHLPLA